MNTLIYSNNCNDYLQLERLYNTHNFALVQDAKRIIRGGSGNSSNDKLDEDGRLYKTVMKLKVFFAEMNGINFVLFL